MTYIFSAILLTSVIGTILSIVLLVLRPFTRKIFSAGWHYYVWLVVLFVMMMPVRVDVTGVFVREQIAQESVTGTENYIDIADCEEVTPVFEDGAQVQTESEYMSETIDNAKNYFADNIYLLSFVWLCGAILIFVAKTLGYIIFIIKMKRLSQPALCPEIKNYTDRTIATRVSDTISAPLVVGVIRPVLILPDREFTPEQLDNILSHELTHIKRNDILYKWVVSVVKCVHWFNPFIYFIGRQINTDCEISCDLTVIKNMSESEKYGYIDTIISLLSHRNSKPVYLTTGMTGSKKILKKRFVMIKNKIEENKKTFIISVISAVVLLVGVLCISGILNGALFKINRENLLTVLTDEQKEDNFNLLFVGEDNNKRADTIMLFEVSKDEIRCISIPRNTVYDGKKVSDILYSKSGNQLLIDVVKKNLNLPVHYYAKVSLSDIKKVVDSVGGVDFDIPMDMIYDDPYQNLHINLKKGMHTLTGEGVTQLLQYRRGYSEGDITRIKLHHKFIKEFIAQKVNKQNIAKLPEVYKIISDSIQTNYPVSKIASDIKMISGITEKNITFEVALGKNEVVDGQLVYSPETKENPKTQKANSFLWPVDSRDISRRYGTRTHPVTGEVKSHNGIDIASKENAPVVSSIEGVVTEVGFHNELGNYLVIENDNGVKVCYGHLSSVDVSEKDKVLPSSVIAKVGKTGNATGANLHFEIYINGQSRDPEELFFESETPKEKEKTDKTLRGESGYGFEHKILENSNVNKIRQSLLRDGNVETTKSEVDLRSNYFVGDYSGGETQIVADKDGKISLYMSVNTDTLFDVKFSDAETNEDAGGYKILANNRNAYTFYGFEKGRKYNMELTPKTKGDWAILGDYIIY